MSTILPVDAVIETTPMLNSNVSSLAESTVTTIDSDNKCGGVDGPPRIIVLPTSQLDRKKAFYTSNCSTPYAQLCYDPQQATLVTIIQNGAAGTSKRRPFVVNTPEMFPSLRSANAAVAATVGTIKTLSSSSSSSSLSSQLSFASTLSLSTVTQPHQSRGAPLPFILGTQECDDEVFGSDYDENCLYLLHDEKEANSGGPALDAASLGCARALQKLCKSTRPLRFLQVATNTAAAAPELQWPKKPFARVAKQHRRLAKHTKQGYEPVQRQTSLKKWL